MRIPHFIVDVKIRLAMVAGCVALVSTGVLSTERAHTPANIAAPALDLFRSLVPFDPAAEQSLAAVPDPEFERATRFVPRGGPVYRRRSEQRSFDAPALQVPPPKAGGTRGANVDDLEPPASAAIPIASTNVQFLANVAIPGALFLGATGGRFQQRDGQTLFFLTSPTGLTVIDATIAAVPIVLGELNIPHYENEDVDLFGNTLLISVDGSWGSSLFVIDISLPSAPRLRGYYKFADEPDKWEARSGPGHIANCIAECRYAYVTGARGGWVAIVDLGDPSLLTTTPTLVASFRPPAGDPNAVFTKGNVHDVNVDPTGLVWLTGSGGISAYGIGGAWPGSPIAPVHVSSNNTPSLDDYILHNSLRPNGGSTLLVTEEDLGAGARNCADDGRFQTYSFDGANIKPLDTWQLPEKTGLYTNGSGPSALACSAHWFDHRDDGLVAIGWYQQGLRLLDVNDPSNVQQVGWFNVPGTIASAAYFHPVAPSVVYVVDYQRGLDVIEVCPGTCQMGVGIGAPVFSQAAMNFKPSADWGYACLVPE